LTLELISELDDTGQRARQFWAFDCFSVQLIPSSAEHRSRWFADSATIATSSINERIIQSRSPREQVGITVQASTISHQCPQRSTASVALLYVASDSDDFVDNSVSPYHAWLQLQRRRRRHHLCVTTSRDSFSNHLEL